MRRSFVSFLAIIFVMSSVASVARADVSPAMYSGMHWRLVGPFRGGRVIAETGVAGDPNTFYFGSVGGGVWKSTNAGRTWKPIFDSQPVASIGAIAVAPSNPNVIYVGSGEADMRSSITHGNGLYKSADAGAHWHRIGLADTYQIGRIVVDPANADRVFVAALGHAYAPNPDRGVFRSSDGGATWQKVLFKNADTGAIDLAMDPSDHNVLYASLWQTRRPPWNIYPPSNGPGSGLYKSTDGGTTWQQLTRGLPSAGLGHIGISISPSRPQRVYAIVDAKQGGLYRSDDGGSTWSLLDGDGRIWKRGWYFCKVTADPKDPDAVYVSNTGFYRSLNGGKSFTVIKSAPGGDDYQGVWIDPTDTRRMILGSDQGAIVSPDGGATWSSWYNQPTAQFYHVATDNRFPYWIYGAQQDSGAVGTMSRSNHLGISFRDWQPIAAGGESNSIAPDPDDARTLYGANLDKYDQTTNVDADINPELAYPNVYRHTWTLPIVFSAQSPHVLYYSSNVLFRSTDKGKSWHIISPDLTRPNPGIPPNLDAVTAHDVHGGARRGVIYSIAPSPLRRGMIWTGTDDGKIWLTQDEGAHWSDVTPRGLGAWSKVGMIEASAHVASTAYAAVDRHRLDDDHPYVYRTRDDGKTWTLVTRGIPANTFVNAVREDPKTPGLLFAGTESGPYVSFNAGDSWQPLQLNLPTVSVRDLSLRQDDVVIATFGRAFWVLDKIGALRDLARSAASTTRLFAPVLAYRVRPGDDGGTPLPLETAQGENPPAGAYIDYYLAQSGIATLEVRDANGRIVRKFSSTDKPQAADPNTATVTPEWLAATPVLRGDAGMHRFVWNFKDEHGIWLPPGTYSVRLAAAGRTFSQSLNLRKDPRARATDADLIAQYAFANRVRALHDRADAAFAQTQSTKKRTNDAGLIRAIDAIAGAAPPSTPDDSIGAPETNLRSLHYLEGALDGLLNQVEGPDAAPSPTQARAYRAYERLLNEALGKWETLRKRIPAH